MSDLGEILYLGVVRSCLKKNPKFKSQKYYIWNNNREYKIVQSKVLIKVKKTNKYDNKGTFRPNIFIGSLSTQDKKEKH